LHHYSQRIATIIIIKIINVFAANAYILFSHLLMITSVCFNGNIIIIVIVMWNRDSVVGTATGYWLEDREVGVRVPVGSRIFSSPSRPDRLWGLPDLS
jgi:cell division protein FtsX